MREALAEAARGVAFVRRDIEVAELEAMHEAGVRGVRFNFLKRLVDSTPHEHYLEIVEKIRPLGWHIVVYFEANELHEIDPELKVLFMSGYPDRGAEQLADLPENALFLRKPFSPSKLAEQVRSILGVS